MLRMWRALEPLDFKVTFGVVKAHVVRDEQVKKRVLESMKIQVRASGWKEHELLGLECA